MQFIISGQRIAVENFVTGKLYTILWKNDTQVTLTCISIGADCVVFQGEAPLNLFTLTMQNADTIDMIEPTQLGTTNYNNLINKPQINSYTLTGNVSLSDIGAAAASDLDDYATNASLVAGLASKQDSLSTAQMAAVNSGITAADVSQIATNKNNILSGKYQTDNTEKTIDIRNNMTFVQPGFFNSDGEIVTAYSHAIYSMSLGTIRYIDFRLSEKIIQTTLSLGKLTDIDGNTKQVFVNDTTLNQHFTIENGNPTDILYIVCFSYQTTPNYSLLYYKDYVSIATAYKTEIEDIISSNHYYNCIDKPIALNGKKLQFFGDSITYGYISAGVRANPTYPDAFGTAVGASSTINSGVNSATLSTVQGRPSIYEAIQNNLDTTADIVFIAGGINDWQLGVNAAILTTAMTNICTYLTSNYTGKVIFITPINHAGRTPIVTPTQSIDSVRKIITEIAIANGYSVVQGWQFPFPVKGANADYISTMFSDLVHPTQVGYNSYAKALQTALV